MDKNRELIHKILDGDATPEEKKDLGRALEADPGFREEFSSLLNVVNVLEQSGRTEAPTGFTAEVMRKLPAGRTSLAARLREFLFAGRVFRWNVASAVAAAVVVLMASVLIVQTRAGRQHDVELATRQDQTPVTVRIEFSAPQARRVAVAGDFNRWSADANRMKRKDGGIWTIELPMRPGVYTYMFIVDGKAWITDPNAEAYRDDGFGYKNSVLRVQA